MKQEVATCKENVSMDKIIEDYNTTIQNYNLLLSSIKDTVNIGINYLRKLKEKNLL